MYRRILISITLLCWSLIVLKAASYDVQLGVSSTQNETCYSDGKIFVKLIGSDVSQLAASDQVSINVLRSGVSYKQHDLTVADFNSNSIFSLDGYPAGTYTIDYTIWIGTNTEIKESISEFTIDANQYLELLVYPTLGGNQVLHGTRPTLSCKPTGRIQLEIVQGKFPYTVKVYKNGSLFRTETYSSRMHSGENPLTAYYKDYYDIEDLGAGSYTFTIEDSCGYEITLSEPIVVDYADFNCISNFATYTSYGSKRVYFSLKDGFFNNVKYDNYSDEWLEYRFALEGEAFSAWKAFSNTLYDVVDSLAAVQGKTYTFEVRVKDCPTSYAVCQAEVLIPEPSTPQTPETCEESFSSSASIIPVAGTGGSDFCACDGGTPDPVEYDKWKVMTSFKICEPYTLPLTYSWVNLNYPQYSYSNSNINLSAMSLLSAEYPLSDDLYETEIQVSLVGADGVVYADTIIKIPPKPKDPEPVDPIPLSWTLNDSVEGGTACGGLPKGGLSINLNCANIPDGATIEMNQTQDGYHFVANYDLSSRTWIFTPSTFSDFTITQSTYDPSECSSSIDLVFSDNFHYGDYEFIINWKDLDNVDRTKTLNYTLSQNTVRYAVGEELSFSTKKTCQGTMYYPSASVVKWTDGDEANKSPLPTRFRVISGNITGYEINGGSTSVGLCNSDSLLITKPGEYVVQAFYSPYVSVPDPSISECTVCVDTINYSPQSLSFEDYYGYLCADTRESSVRGGITVIAKDGSGVPPYRYDLYSGTDESGTLVGSNYTGVFQDIVVSSAQFYVRVTDQCLSSFGVAIPLSPIIISDVILGDRTVCTGSPASLQGKMIGATNLVSYQWTGSEGFSSDTKQIVTPDIFEPSTYMLEISGLGCSILDSITVEPVDEIKLYYEDLICQGTDYDGGEEYKQAISTSSLPVGVYDFSSGPFPAVKGGCDSTANLRLHIIDENSIIEDTILICNDQLPFFWQDSLFTEETLSGVYYKAKSNNGCNYKQALRLTVGYPSDLQFERIICEGDTVIFNDKTYDTTGSYTDRFITQTFCDSLETLHLTVIQPDETVLYDSIFQEESYDQNGFSFPVQYDLGERYSSMMLKNEYGCDSTVSLHLEVLSPLVDIPEVFTPNGDNKNSFFKIKNIEIYPLNHILIFNRWGNKVYEGKPYMNEWDGKNYFGPKIGGDELPVGTYFYILDLGDGSDIIKGFIYLNK